MIRTIPVLGLPIAVTTYEEAASQVLAWSSDSTVRLVEAANTHVVSLARHDADFKAVMEEFDLVCPDGMPLVWAINKRLPASDRLTDRVYGPTLMLKTLEASVVPQHKHFLFGGRNETLESLKARFADDFEEGLIVGSYSPPFGEWPDGEFEKISRLISESGANIVWVGLGCPKQERWVAQHKESLPPAVYLTVGAAFAFHAGEVRQAPGFLQKIGCEWLYRLLMEPRRLFKRYFVYNSLYLYYTIFG